MKLKPVDVIAFAVPIVLTLGFLAAYLISPKFYLDYILQHENREKQACEVITDVSAMLAWPILLAVGWVQLRREWRKPRASWLPGGPVFLIVTGLAALFFAGEELSWGQTIFQWQTPDEFANVSRETNLHNSGGHLSSLVHFAGNAYLAVMFFVIPVLWHFREKLRLPLDWACGIAPWPVVFCAICSFLIRVEKTIFWKLTTPEHRLTSGFYFDYLEEISEQKEMLVAVAMLMFALYAWAAMRRRAGLVAPEPMPADVRAAG